MSEKHHIIPVWFFVGVLFVIYGVLILGSGLVHWSHPAPGVELANLHAPVWWGALLIVLGVIYCAKYYPRGET
jgi:hypothetical protein